MSDNENVPLSKLREMERYRNAERLAKSLKPYLPSPPSSDELAAAAAASAKSRGGRFKVFSDFLYGYKYSIWSNYKKFEAV